MSVCTDETCLVFRAATVHIPKPPAQYKKAIAEKQQERRQYEAQVSLFDFWKIVWSEMDALIYKFVYLY